LQGYSALVDVHDPWVGADEAKNEYGIELTGQPVHGQYDAVVITVGHDHYCELGEPGLRAYCRPDGILYDVKYLLPANAVDGRL